MGEQHEKAVDRIKKILRSRGVEILENYWGLAGNGCYELPKMETDKGPRQWLLDVYAEVDYVVEVPGRPSVTVKRRFAVEVDGPEPGQGHTGQGKVKDDFRDSFLKKHFGLVTYRFFTPYLVGKGALKDNSLFLKEMGLL